MEIQNPRRILAVSLAGSAHHLSRVIKDLTGNHPAPSPATGLLAGTTHPLQLSTAYYSATVPVWLDLISDAPADAAWGSSNESNGDSDEGENSNVLAATGGTLSGPASWAAAFLAPEAHEVLAALGGLVVVFAIPPRAGGALPLAPVPPSDQVLSLPSETPDTTTTASATSTSQQPDQRDRTRALIASVGRVVREGLGGWAWDGVGLAIGIGCNGSSSADNIVSGLPGEEAAEYDEWDECCAEAGLEFLCVPAASGPGSGSTARNEFGEKTGLARALEALEANEWDGSGGGLVRLDGLDGEEDGYGGLREGADHDEFSDFEDFEIAAGSAVGGGWGKKKRKGDEEDGNAEVEDSDSDGEGSGEMLDPRSLSFGYDREDFTGLRRAIWSGGREDDERDEEGDDEMGGKEQREKPEKDMDAVSGAEAAHKAISTVPAGAGNETKESGSTTITAAGDNLDANDGTAVEEHGISEDDIRKLEGMMRKLQAVRDMGAGMPEGQRRRLASQAVGEVMRDLEL